MSKYKIGDVLVHSYGIGVVTSVSNNLENQYNQPDNSFKETEVILYGLNGFTNSGQLTSGNSGSCHSVRESQVKGKIEYA